MKYGYFDDLNKEYVITTPLTPQPWINYLGTDDFFSLISNTGGGYSFYKDAKLRRITRYRYNSVPKDTGGRCYYIKENDTIFSPAFLPAKVLPQKYACRQGLGYTIFESTYNQIESKLLCFVPSNSNCEINSLTIKNTSNQIKTISLYSMVEFCLWNAVDDSTNFQRNLSIGEVEVDDYAVYHKTEYRERRNHYSFFSANRKHDGFDTDLDSFLGRFNSFENPIAVANGVSYNTIASGGSPIGCHRFDLILKANEETNIVFILGYIENEDEEKFDINGQVNKNKAIAMQLKFDNAEKVTAEFNNLKNEWANKLGALKIESNDSKLDRMVNIWNQYQCMVTFNLSRSASYFESGTGRGIGFRDSAQDLLGGMHLIPFAKSRERILDLAAIQFENGSTYHQFQPLTKLGNSDIGGGFNDDPLWLIACTVAYIKETGDKTILDELIPFNSKKGSEKTLFEHLRRSINFTIKNKGLHNLPLIGRADWNDCINLNCFSQKPGESFQTCSNFEGNAESVFIAGMFVYYGRQYAELCARFGDKIEAEYVLSHVELVNNAVIESGWDGEWFLRAYDSLGQKVGSKDCDDGKIFIEPQGFCTMAGIGGSEFGKKAINSVKKYLLNDYGIELVYPPYSKYHKELGEVTSYPKGYKENGSVFCHSNPWVAIAATKLGDSETAFDLFARHCPAYVEDKSDILTTEPYVYSQMIAGRSAPRYGQAKNSWLTGTASWNMVLSSQSILGVIPDYDGLKIQPCISNQIKTCKIKRLFRGSLYNIEITNKDLGNIKIFVDGVLITNNIIKPKNKVINIRVEM